jgi:hypothetical protein
VLARISQTLSAAARDEQKRAHRSQRWASAAEAVLAAVGAPIVLVSSGVQIGSVAAGLLTCVLGATLLVYGRRLNLWRHP